MNPLTVLKVYRISVVDHY